MLWIIHYSEIGLKKRNRFIFEKKLKENIKIQTGAQIENKRGRILALGENLEEKLKKIPGIEYFSKIIGIYEKPEDIIKDLKINFTSFSVKVKRGDKDWPENSIEIKNKIIKLILKENPNLKVNFKNPEKTIFLEYFDKKFYFYLEKIKGLGGLPVGTSGKCLSLLSAGFDSPIASFLMLKRGIKVDFVHFYAYPQTDLLEKEAVLEIVKILAEYQPTTKIYFINILEAQKYIFQNIPSKYLIIFYRRLMIAIAKKLAEKFGYKALITGESVGQTSSQTVENMWSTSFDSDFLILRPLLGFNKQEIIDLAYKIGTGKISEKNYKDCCNLFLPQKPATKSRVNKILQLKKKLVLWENLIDEALKKIEIYHWPGK